MIKQKKKKERKKKKLSNYFGSSKYVNISDLPSDVAICHQIIAYKLKIDSLSPKTENGYLLRR